MSEIVAQLGQVLVLAGNGPTATPIYWAAAGAVVLFALVAPALAPKHDTRDLAGPWMLALLAIFGLVTSIGFAYARSASYLVSFPLYFYALLLVCNGRARFQDAGPTPARCPRRRGSRSRRWP